MRDRSPFALDASACARLSRMTPVRFDWSQLDADGAMSPMSPSEAIVAWASRRTTLSAEPSIASGRGAGTGGGAGGGPNQQRHQLLRASPFHPLDGVAGGVGVDEDAVFHSRSASWRTRSGRSQGGLFHAREARGGGGRGGNADTTTTAAASTHSQPHSLAPASTASLESFERLGAFFDIVGALSQLPGNAGSPSSSSSSSDYANLQSQTGNNDANEADQLPLDVTSEHGRNDNDDLVSAVLDDGAAARRSACDALLNSLDSGMRMMDRLYSRSFATWIRSDQSLLYIVRNMSKAAALTVDAPDRLVAGLLWMLEFSFASHAHFLELVVQELLTGWPVTRIVQLAATLGAWWYFYHKKALHPAGTGAASSSSSSTSLASSSVSSPDSSCTSAHTDSPSIESMQAALDDVSLFLCHHRARSIPSTPASNPPQVDGVSSPLRFASPSCSPRVSCPDSASAPGGAELDVAPSLSGATATARRLGGRERRQHRQQLQLQQRQLQDRLKADQPAPREQQVTHLLGFVIASLSPTDASASLSAITRGWPPHFVSSLIRQLEMALLAPVGSDGVSSDDGEGSASLSGRAGTTHKAMPRQVATASVRARLVGNMERFCQSFATLLSSQISRHRLATLQQMRALYETRLAVAQLKLEMAKVSLSIAKCNLAMAGGGSNNSTPASPAAQEGTLPPRRFRAVEKDELSLSNSQCSDDGSVLVESPSATSPP
ncbi:hypothetical protein CAOG_02743 [Capsaspora owczarzaki ATCC 30864]|uniref:Uncharacterized protein n=1 Tax=Capsaspora owczarzaki (strain ATCC 30864) TaxID=595528 RepID=A0A0D2WLV6_CAPO3|nr:hypothetical protein CAOG_02743 [Capsaspora owczarzaki ATCC 30864]KJE91630.1 hypothetical protein CAOG_002743 [Capsaspora owczarzaki ATCC 30864]|eukprot:XP_004349493.1 hypothetical protein CAOG_02743 [Capsaspora owczarzaki ATCC 30864]